MWRTKALFCSSDLRSNEQEMVDSSGRFAMAALELTRAYNCRVRDEGRGVEGYKVEEESIVVPLMYNV